MRFLQTSLILAPLLSFFGNVAASSFDWTNATVCPDIVVETPVSIQWTRSSCPFVYGIISSDLTGDISQLLTGDISGLTGVIRYGLFGDISGLSGDISGLTGYIHPSLEGHISGLTGDISSDLFGHISSYLTGDINPGLTGDISSLNGDITCLVGDVTDVQYTGLQGGLTCDDSAHLAAVTDVNAVWRRFLELRSC